MRKIITTTMITLDGVMQAPGTSKEDTAEGFKYGGWMVGWDVEADKITDRIQAVPFDLLFGRRTYDIFADFWPKHKDEPHWGKPYDRAKKYVVSHKPHKLPWDNSELITGDVVAEINKLKKSDGRDLPEAPRRAQEAPVLRLRRVGAVQRPGSAVPVHRVDRRR
jgi:dihydrofolate reductase